MFLKWKQNKSPKREWKVSNFIFQIVWKSSAHCSAQARSRSYSLDSHHLLTTLHNPNTLHISFGWTRCQMGEILQYRGVSMVEWYRKFQPRHTPLALSSLTAATVLPRTHRIQYTLLTAASLWSQWEFYRLVYDTPLRIGAGSRRRLTRDTWLTLQKHTFINSVYTHKTSQNNIYHKAAYHKNVYKRKI